MDLILDGGECAVGLESTIIDMSREDPVILRPGMITSEQLSAVLKQPILSARQDTPVTRTPGMHHLHYAPLTATRLLTALEIPRFVQTLGQNNLPVAVVMHSQLDLPSWELIHRVSMPSKSEAYAHHLYSTLRSLDHSHVKQIIIEAVPDTVEWDAIRDRLNKASGGRG